MANVPLLLPGSFPPTGFCSFSRATYPNCSNPLIKLVQQLRMTVTSPSTNEKWPESKSTTRHAPKAWLNLIYGLFYVSISFTPSYFRIVHIFELCFSILSIVCNCIMTVLSREASPISVSQRKMLVRVIWSLKGAVLGSQQLKLRFIRMFSIG